jgi:cytochrome P450
VRINPNELHVDDPDYYDVVYATNKLYDKMDFFSHRFNMPLATFGTAESDKHKIRRAAIAPFFNRNRIRGHNDYIQRVADRISHRLVTEYAGTSKVVDLVQMWGAMTSDVISEIVFARPKGYVEYKDFRSDFTNSLNDMVFTSHIMTHFGFILTIMNALPNWFVKLAVPAIKSVIEFREVRRSLTHLTFKDI